MATHNQCSINLDEELSQMIIANKVDISRNPEDIYRMQDYLNKISLQRQLDIIERDKQFQSLKGTLDSAVDTYKNKKFKVSYGTALISLIQTNTKSSKGARANLEQTIISLDKENLGIFGAELNKIDHYRFSNGIDVETEAGAKLNNDILKEVAGENTNNSLAKEYANAIKITTDAVNQKTKAIGIETYQKKSFTGLQSHYERALRNEGFDKWYTDLKNTANLEQTSFLQSKEISLRIYNKLTGDAGTLDTRDIPVNYKESVEAFLKNDEIVFKTIDDEINYINTYGKPVSAVNILGSSLGYKSKKIGERMILGKNPQKTLEKLYNYARGKDAELKNKEIKFSKVQTIYDEVMGRHKIENQNIARVSRDIRKFFDTTLYGSTLINSPINDQMTRSLINFSKNGSQGELLFNLANSVPKGVSQVGEIIFKAIDPARKGGLTKDETIHLNKLGITANVMNAQIGRIFDEIGDLGVGNKISKFVDGVSKYFTKLSGLEAMDNIQSMQIHTLLSSDMFKNLSIRNWNNLPKGERMQLLRYGIAEEDYNALSKLVNSVESTDLNGKLFDPNYVKDLTNDDLGLYVAKELKDKEAFYKNAGLEFDNELRQAVYDKARLKLETKVRTLYNGETHILLGKADTRRNFITRGAKAGTGTGEALRFFMQAKTYPLLYIDNVVKNVYYSTAIDTNSKFASFVAFAGASIIGGIIVEQVNEVLSNKSPKELDANLINRGIIRSGFLGLAGDMLTPTLGNIFDFSKKTGAENKAELYRNIINATGGVATTRAIDILEGINNLTAKNSDPDKLIKSIKANIPLSNLYYVKGLTSYVTMGLSEAMGGKGLRKERRRLSKENKLFNDDRRELIFDPLD